MRKSLGKKSEKKTEYLKISKKRYQQLIRHSPEGIFVFQDCVFRLKNKQFETLLGPSSQKSCLNDPDRVFFLDRLRKYLLSTEENQDQDKSVRHFGFTISQQNRGKRDLKAVVTTIDYRGKPAIHGMVRDVTNGEMGRPKSSSLAIAAHEIRTAITVISGYNKMLLRKQIGPLNDTQRKVLKECKRSCDRLKSIVNQILDCSRVEGQKAKMHFQEKDIGACIRNIYNEFRHLARDKQISLKTRIPRKDVLKVTFDQNKIEQVLINLTKNAIDNTPKGGTVTLQVSPPRENFIKICVADTGIGVPLEDREIVFGAFTKGKKFEDTEGMGLGLAICREMIELHQGRIWVEPRKGGGSKFMFTLPLKRSRIFSPKGSHT